MEFGVIVKLSLSIFCHFTDLKNKKKNQSSAMSGKMISLNQS